MKLYVDTNWFLSFYQSNHERLDVLPIARQQAPMFVLTEQNVAEFRRNRAAIFQRMRDNVVKSVSVNPYTTTILRGLDEHRRLLEQANSLKKAGEELVRKIDGMEASLAIGDPVMLTFYEILSRCTLIKVTDADIQRAERRKARGIPPSSSKRDTIGDEVIWECLLRACEEDLAIVSLDGDFLQQRELLASEFGAHSSRRRIVHYGDKASVALAMFAGLTEVEYRGRFGVDPWARCRTCGALDWLYAGRDHASAIEHEGVRAAGFTPGPSDMYQKAVHVCGFCNAKILVV